MKQVYIAPEVADVIALYTYVTDAGFRQLPIRDQLARQAETLHTAKMTGDARVRFQIMCWWPDAIGRSATDVLKMPFGPDDACLTIAREYGFQNWNEIDKLGDAPLPDEFESALDDLLSGDAASLKRRLEASPPLARKPSVFGHGATLLHYLGANGVETHRQKTPHNAADLARLLIDHGADRDAKANMYGGGQTALALASTSAHPAKAGVLEELAEVLKTPT